MVLCLSFILLFWSVGFSPYTAGYEITCIGFFFSLVFISILMAYFVFYSKFLFLFLLLFFFLLFVGINRYFAKVSGDI
ncbi:hypothetical protein BDZ91DRAFT_715205 [Kalaharituber pfeilii]|nr:hypothetical protein BDZ91DRAFT_715205 [Kalaharituber pfeilii]